MIHGGNHRNYGLAVGERKNRDLRACEEFFYHHLIAAVSEHSVLHYGLDGVFRFFPGLGDYDALAQSQTVCFYHYRYRTCFYVLKSLFHIVESLVFRRRYAVFFHQILGKGLAALDDGSLFVRSESLYPLCSESVNRPKHQRIIRSDHGKVDGFFHCEFNDLVDVLCPYINADGVLRYSSVAGKCENLAYALIFLYLFYYGVLSSPAAYYHYFHVYLRFASVGSGEARAPLKAFYISMMEKSYLSQ